MNHQELKIKLKLKNNKLLLQISIFLRKKQIK
jgi:hypothetical protein